MIESILVIGGGSAGLLAAITLKRVLPHLEVSLVRSPEIGIIGVGEGTTPFFPRHLLRFLKLPPAELHERARPTWKLGIRFLWGPRPEFFYTFDRQFSLRFADLPRNNGFYCTDDCTDLSPLAALMARDRAFPTGPGGHPLVPLDAVAWHIENVRLVACLEWQARTLGITIEDDTVEQVQVAGESVAEVVLRHGGPRRADLFVDASGFHARLVGEALEEPFLDYSGALLCDRAVVAPRERRPGETIQPYTTAETMDHGWCWRIDHEHHINRGYVYSSAFTDDARAEEEFRRVHPGAGPARIVRFRSGRRRRAWIGNVVAVGNAAGFVEPLEATALMILCAQCRTLAESLVDSLGEPGPVLRDCYNRFLGTRWDEIRDFLALHYRFNTRRSTPFWETCRRDTPLGALTDLVDFYKENGPSTLAEQVVLSSADQFGIEGYLAMLVGMNVPHRKSHEPDDDELARLRAHKAALAGSAMKGASVADALKFVRDPRWVWPRA